MAQNNHKGVSLAKGPVALVGLALLAYGVTAFLFGGHSFAAEPISGTVNGKTWLGVEVNAWSSLLFIGAGALLLFGSPLHWGAKSLALIVGLALGAASLIALYDKHDVLGIFAVNGLTKLVWGAAATALLILALLPRVGGKTQARRARRSGAPTPAPRHQRVADPEPARFDRQAHEPSRDAGNGRTTPEPDGTPRRRRDGKRVVASAPGPTPESRDTSHGERNGQL
jgi:hypothetical protein